MQVIKINNSEREVKKENTPRPQSFKWTGVFKRRGYRNFFGKLVLANLRRSESSRVLFGQVLRSAAAIFVLL